MKDYKPDSLDPHLHRETFAPKEPGPAEDKTAEEEHKASADPGGAPQRDRAQQLRAALRPGGDLQAALTSDYVVKEMIDAGTFSSLYGEPGAAKSFLALDLGLHVAAGTSWNGRRVKAGAVVYIASEGGASFGNRVAAWRREHPDLWGAAAGRFLVLPVTIDLCHGGDGEALATALDGLKPTLIVVDTLARSMGVGDENSTSDMGLFVANCGVLRGLTGAHVMAVHHSGKDTSKGARGSSALRAAVDTELKVTVANGVSEMTVDKQRDHATGGVVAFRLRRVELCVDQDGDPVTSCVIEPTEPVEKKAKLTGGALVAAQALDDAIQQRGQRQNGEGWPPVRVVPLTVWREFCDLHGLSSGEEEAQRKAFMRQRNHLNNSGLTREFAGYVWRVPSGTNGTKRDMSQMSHLPQPSRT